MKTLKPSLYKRAINELVMREPKTLPDRLRRQRAKAKLDEACARMRITYRRNRSLMPTQLAERVTLSEQMINEIVDDIVTSEEDGTHHGSD